jgi:hypothetical protein
MPLADPHSSSYALFCEILDEEAPRSLCKQARLPAKSLFHIDQCQAHSATVAKISSYLPDRKLRIGNSAKIPTPPWGQTIGSAGTCCDGIKNPCPACAPEAITS